MTAQNDTVGASTVHSLGLTEQRKPLRAGGEVMSVAAARRVIARAGNATWVVATDVLLLLAIVVAVPLVVLAVGVPIALAVRLLLRIAQLL